MSLRDAQQALWRAVRFDPTPADALAQFADGPRLDAAASLAVYRNMYWYRQVDALTEMFPKTHAALGAERFTKLACHYIRQHPSQHPALEFLGRALPDFLRTRAPEQADLARLEWFRSLALVAPDPAAIARAGEIVPEAFPGARLSFVASLYVTDVDRAALLAYGHDETDLAPHLDDEGRVQVAVYRRGFSVRQLPLARAEASALQTARRGVTVAALLAEVPATDDGIQHAFRMIHSWFARDWIEAIQT